MKKQNNSIGTNICRDVLMLIDYNVPFSVIMGWSENTKQKVFNYAISVHLRASDNNNRVPKKPKALLKKFLIN